MPLRNEVGETKMGIFNLFKKKETAPKAMPGRPVSVHMAEPQFYEDTKTGGAFGVLCLSEDTVTALPFDPKSSYLIDGKKLDDWRLFLFSSTEDKTLGEMEYYSALERLRSLANFGNTYVIGEKDGHLITTPLTLDQMKTLLNAGN